MNRFRIWTCALACVALLSAAGAARGGVVEFLDDRDGWLAAVGPFTTINFTGFPDGTFITTQYADLGVVFTDGNDQIFLNGNAFPNDGAGMDGNGDIEVAFDTPQAWIAVDFPGAIKFQLFSERQLIYDSSSFFAGGFDHFFGLVSTELFDSARIIDPLGEAEIDDLHFGVPAPGTLPVLGSVGLIGRGRRSRRR
jgi:hypothetical protein